MENDEKRERALQLASEHQLPNDTAESIVERAQKYAAFLAAK